MEQQQLIEATEEELNAILRTDFPSFVKKCFQFLRPGTPLKWNWHLDLQCSWMVDIIEGRRKRVIVNVPPRSLKSFIFTIAGTAWAMGKNPSEEIMCVSYADSLTTEHSIMCRAIIESDWYMDVFPKMRLAYDQNEKTKFKTTRSGQRVATSVGASATGMGGNLIILDDPMNPKKAQSDTEREANNKWVDSTVFSRLNDKDIGAIVIVMQRLHEEDTVGHMLAKDNANEWDTLILPAENGNEEEEKKDPEMQRAQDILFKYRYGEKFWKKYELLHGERLSAHFLKSEKSNIGEDELAGQYMQRPARKGGSVFRSEWFRYYADNKGFKQIIQSWDTAYKNNAYNDPSCCTTWGVREDGFYLLDVFCERMLYPELKIKVKEHGNDFKADLILIEDRASGQSLIQQLKSESRIPVTPIIPNADKITRAHASSIYFQRGQVFLPQVASWRDEYEAEILMFPRSKHDDRVDSTSQFLNWLRAGYLDEIKAMSFYDEDEDIDYSDSQGYNNGRSRISGY